MSDAKIAEARMVRDRLNAAGQNGDLYMRLRGFYWAGPKDTPEPEFGYRDFSGAELRQPIQSEAADSLAALADLAEAQAQEIARLRDILKMAARTIDTLANESEIGREDVDWEDALREANAALGETQ